uniref:CCHC-type domain-containing protein n=1 Tax=Oryza brachyantha TaxID=4533 RepID=J3NFF4_ORYBR
MSVSEGVKGGNERGHSGELGNSGELAPTESPCLVGKGEGNWPNLGGNNKGNESLSDRWVGNQSWNPVWGNAPGGNFGSGNMVSGGELAKQNFHACNFEELPDGGRGGNGSDGRGRHSQGKTDQQGWRNVKTMGETKKEWGKKEFAGDAQKNGDQGGRLGPVLKCFRCGQDGHHQATCTKPPLCYACQQIGHISANCPSGVGKKVVKSCGFSIPGQGFYSLQVDRNADNKNKHIARGILSIKEGQADVARVVKELNELFPDLKWDWRVKQLNETDFLVNFPSEENKNFFTRFPSFDFRCLSIKAMHLYINKVRYDIVWEPEGYQPKEKDATPPGGDDDEDKGGGDGGDNNGGGGDDGNFDDEDLLDDDDEDTDFKKMADKLLQDKISNSVPPTHKRKSYAEVTSSTQNLCFKRDVSSEQALVLWEVKGNQESQEEELPLSAVPLSQAEVISGFEGDSKVLELSQEEKCDIPTDSDLERLREEEDLEDNTQFQEVISKKREVNKKKGPALASRMSLRQKDKDIPVPLKAKMLTQRKNLEELDYHINAIEIPYIIGGDFNLYRFAHEKSNDHLNCNKTNFFRFEPAWFLVDGFKELLSNKMIPRDGEYILSHWNKMLALLRKFLRGWSANNTRVQKQAKRAYIDQLEKLDELDEGEGLSHDQWKERYEIEESLERLYEAEESAWMKISGEQWILEGDRNTDFFHAVANGRKRKCGIHFLEDGDRTITDQVDLNQHIISYYKMLFREEESASIHLRDEIWENRFCLKEEDKEVLIEPFNIFELDKVIKEAKLNTAPGPDSFPIQFYRVFWDFLKPDFLEMLILLHNELDLKRLNYGVITLIPKVGDAINIKQYRPICVLNESFKIITKVLANRLAQVADKVISPTQNAFIPGRAIRFEACLSSIPTYAMGLYLLPEGIHKKFDSIGEMRTYGSTERVWGMGV